MSDRDVITRELAVVMLVLGYVLFPPGRRIADRITVPEGHLYVWPMDERVRWADKFGPRMAPATPEAIEYVRAFWEVFQEYAKSMKGGQP